MGERMSCASFKGRARPCRWARKLYLNRQANRVWITADLVRDPSHGRVAPWTAAVNPTVPRHVEHPARRLLPTSPTACSRPGPSTERARQCEGRNGQSRPRHPLESCIDHRLPLHASAVPRQASPQRHPVGGMWAPTTRARYRNAGTSRAPPGNVACVEQTTAVNEDDAGRLSSAVFRSGPRHSNRGLRDTFQESYGFLATECSCLFQWSRVVINACTRRDVCTEFHKYLE